MSATPCALRAPNPQAPPSSLQGIIAGNELSPRAAAPASERPRPKILPPILTVLVLVAGIVSYVGYQRYQAKQPYEWSGTIEVREIKAGSRTGGRVQEVLVREGDQVKAKQPLLVLERGDLAAQQLMAQAALDEAIAVLEKHVKGSRQGDIIAANAHSNGASVSLSKARVDAERVRRLFASGAVSKAEVDNAEASLRAARASATEAAAGAQVVAAGSRNEDIKGARASVEAAKGRLDQILVMIDELTIVAPRDARVESLDLRPGDILAANATAVTLLEESELYLRIYVPETQIGHIQVGQTVPFTVDSFVGRSFKGKVENISSVGEYSPRNLQTADERANQVFATRVGVVEGASDLRAGMAAFIRVPK